MSVQPTLRLPMPYQNQLIPHDSKVLGADRTPNLARLMSLSKLLFYIIFPASKAEVARSNRAGQAKGLTGR